MRSAAALIQALLTQRADHLLDLLLSVLFESMKLHLRGEKPQQELQD